MFDSAGKLVAPGGDNACTSNTKEPKIKRFPNSTTLLGRISSDKVSREAKKVPNTVSASSRIKPITVSQPSVITKKGMNSNSNGFSSTGLDHSKTRRPQPRSNIKNDRVLSASKSSRSMHKDVKVEEHHRNLLLSKKNKHRPFLQELPRAADSHDIRDQLSVLFRREVAEDLEKMEHYCRLSNELKNDVRMRDKYIRELQISHMSDEDIESIKILRRMQVNDMEKASPLLLMAKVI
nr:hypothetical protein [Tanacetum cinerariifolium]